MLDHSRRQFIVLLGGAGGRLQGGRVLDYLGKSNRKMCSLYMALMDKMGLRLERFGDSRERLAEVWSADEHGFVYAVLASSPFWQPGHQYAVRLSSP